MQGDVLPVATPLSSPNQLSTCQTRGSPNKIRVVEVSKQAIRFVNVHINIIMHFYYETHNS